MKQYFDNQFDLDPPARFDTVHSRPKVKIQYANAGWRPSAKDPHAQKLIYGTKTIIYLEAIIPGITDYDIIRSIKEETDGELPRPLYKGRTEEVQEEKRLILNPCNGFGFFRTFIHFTLALKNDLAYQKDYHLEDLVLCLASKKKFSRICKLKDLF